MTSGLDARIARGRARPGRDGQAARARRGQDAAGRAARRRRGAGRLRTAAARHARAGRAPAGRRRWCWPRRARTAAGRAGPALGPAAIRRPIRCAGRRPLAPPRAARRHAGRAPRRRLRRSLRRRRRVRRRRQQRQPGHPRRLSRAGVRAPGGSSVTRPPRRRARPPTAATTSSGSTRRPGAAHGRRHHRPPRLVADEHRVAAWPTRCAPPGRAVSRRCNCRSGWTSTSLPTWPCSPASTVTLRCAASRSTGLREIYLHVTHRCGRDCRHCYNKDAAWDPDELTTAEWKDAIDQCVALGASSFVFIGGDPLLRDDFVELLDHITGTHEAHARFFFNSYVDEATAAELSRAGRGLLTAPGQHRRAARGQRRAARPRQLRRRHGLDRQPAGRRPRAGGQHRARAAGAARPDAARPRAARRRDRPAPPHPSAPAGCALAGRPRSGAVRRGAARGAARAAGTSPPRSASWSTTSRAGAAASARATTCAPPAAATSPSTPTGACTPA